MDYITHSFRYGLEIFETQPKFNNLWKEITNTLDNITDNDIINYFQTQKRKAKSISEALNSLIEKELIALHWKNQSPIFNDTKYQKNRWKLDFAKDNISIEVAFNHGEAIAWNLIKPVLASELNHVEKAIQTKAGIIICATKSMKKAGGFDSATGTYEKFLRYLIPLNNLLTVPMVIIGLGPPKKFEIKHQKKGNKKIGIIKKLN
ncbi:BglII/BstYI family type II restriction endonuclease [Vallitalea guaymasensis]|uniref:BglII/BstYI family type II restriction endonuclease n=1 Tax=Vallitalea guaymasensis TaxID=1185412 RepID=UPI000DE2B64B|nr:BglII/BstYI family type II restriction endonuclease [Vallitalea guaymasensis]